MVALPTDDERKIGPQGYVVANVIAGHSGSGPKLIVPKQVAPARRLSHLRRSATGSRAHQNMPLLE